MNGDAQKSLEITIFPFLLPVFADTHGCERPVVFLVLPTASPLVTCMWQGLCRCGGLGKALVLVHLAG